MTSALAAAPLPRPTTPRRCLEALLAGNHRFTGNTRRHPDPRTWAEAGRAPDPFAAVFSCADSRVAPELIFDCGLGDLVTVRSPGHAVDADVVAALERQMRRHRLPLLAVVGHQGCAAIAASLADRAQGAALRALDGSASPAGRGDSGRCPAAPALEQVVTARVRLSVHDLVEASPLVQAAVAAGTMAVVGLTFSLGTGEVAVVETAGALSDVPAPRPSPPRRTGTTRLPGSPPRPPATATF